MIAVPSSATAREAVDALDSVLAEGQRTGVINASAYDQLTAAATSIRAALDKGHGHSATNQVNDLRELVADLEQQGQVTGAAVAALDTAVTAISQRIRTSD